MIAYLDTSIAIWLSHGKIASPSTEAKSVIRRAELPIWPMVLLELEILYEIQQTNISTRDIHLKIEHELGVRVCGLGISSIVSTAAGEKWTRNPFNRMIVAHAKANGFSALVSADESIRKHYSRTIW